MNQCRMCNTEVKYGMKWYCSWECKEGAKLQRLRAVYPNIVYRWTERNGSQVKIQEKFRCIDSVNNDKYKHVSKYLTNIRG